MDEDIKHLNKEKDVIITEKHDNSKVEKHDESKLLMEKENVGIENDVTNKEGHVFGKDVRDMDLGVTGEGSSLPGVAEVVKQSGYSVDGDCDPEKADVRETRTKIIEVKSCIATEGKGNSLADNREERMKTSQNEDITITEQAKLGGQMRIMEEMEVSQSLEGVLKKVESSTEGTIAFAQDHRNASEGVEMDCLGEEIANQNHVVNVVGNVGTPIIHEIGDTSQVNVSTKMVDEMNKMKDNTNNVTTNTYAKVGIEVKKEPLEEDLNCLSNAILEVETGEDGGMVTGMDSLVAYSSSDDEDSLDSSASSSTSSSSSDSDSDDSSSSGRKVEKEAGDKKEEEKMKDEEDEDEDKEAGKNPDDSSGPPPAEKAKTELMLQDLPEVPYVDFRLADGEEINLLGKVSSIIGQLVVVASNRGTPALNEDTVLFKENRHPIGVVFEIFGPVSNPFYTVRFNSTKDISDLELTLNADIFFAPRQEEITNYVFVRQLTAVKGSDASWINDEEPPPECLDYSDDEAEKNAKKKKVLEDGKRKPARLRNDSSSQDNATSEGITGPQTFRNARGGHYQYTTRGGHSHGPYHGNIQRARTPFNTRTSYAEGERHHRFSHNVHQQHGDHNWSQQQRHISPPRMPFQSQNIPPFGPSFAYNSNFPQRAPLLPFHNQGLASGGGPTFWHPQPQQHFTGAPHPPFPPAMSPYSVPPPPFMSLSPLNPISSTIGMVPPPPPPGPPP